MILIKDLVPKAAIQLDPTMKAEYDTKRNMVGLHTARRVYFVRADGPKECAKWVQSLQFAISRSQSLVDEVDGNKGCSLQSEEHNKCQIAQEKQQKIENM